MLHQGVAVADGAGEHAGQGVAVLADDAHQLQLQAVVVQRTQTQFLLGQIHIFAGLLVVLVLVRRIDVAEGPLADLLIAPVLLGGVHGLGGHEGVHVLRDGVVGLQADGVEHQIGDLVVLVHDQHHLVVTLRPAAVEHVVLVL